MSPIELRTRTPLGAVYRTPLGVFGPGEVALYGPIRGQVQGTTDTLTAAWHINSGCVEDDSTTDLPFDEEGYRQTNWEFFLTPAEDKIIPNAVLLTYTFIGETSGFRFRLDENGATFHCSRDFNPSTRYDSNTGPLLHTTIADREYWDQFILIRKTITTNPEELFNIQVTTNYNIPGAVSHPAFQDFEFIDGYPPGQVPP